MPREVRAAVFHEGEEGALIETLLLDDPADGEVVIEMAASGACHTDVSAAGVFPRPSVFGHEGAGTIIEVGGGVTKVKPGDRVVATFGSCGVCESCKDDAPAYCWKHSELTSSGRRVNGETALTTKTGEPVFGSFFQQSSFASHALATERNVVKIPDALSFVHAAPLGCGVQTGVGAIVNSLQLQGGQSVVVFGAGAVGLSAIMAAAMLGCSVIIAVDIKGARLDLARSLGATDVVNPNDGDVVEAIKDITGGGAHYSFETAGTPETFQAAINVLRPRGACGVAAFPTAWGEVAPHPGGNVLMATRLIGVIEGNSDPDRFIPQMIEWSLDGKLPYHRLIKTYPFEAINDALADMKSGVTIKPVLTFG